MDAAQVENIVRQQNEILLQQISVLLSKQQSTVIDPLEKFKVKYGEYVSVPAFASELNCSPSTIRERIKSGAINRNKVSQGKKNSKILIHVSELVKALNSNKSNHKHVA